MALSFRERSENMKPQVKLLLAIGLIWCGGLFWFARQVADAPIVRDHAADGIAVLTGGRERVTVGFDLLKQGAAKKLLLSGVNPEVNLEDIAKLFEDRQDLFDCCVELGREAKDTVGNAQEAAKWARANNMKAIVVVTASYHMPRAMVEFRRTLPEITLYGQPAFPSHVKLDDWWQWPGTALLVIEEYSKFLISVIRWRVVASSDPASQLADNQNEATP